jgi:hypothetical protein
MQRLCGRRLFQIQAIAIRKRRILVMMMQGILEMLCFTCIACALDSFICHTRGKGFWYSVFIYSATKIIEIAILANDVDTYNNTKDNTTCCSICLQNFEIGNEQDEDRIKLPCDHEFHRACIREWLLHQRSCPLCRNKLKTMMLGSY